MPEKLRIVFMGTPAFAVGCLKEILKTKHEVAGIVTSPDKPAGRGKQMMASEVKEYVTALDIGPVFQPESLKDPGFIEELKKLNADLFIVVAFRMLPEVIWSMPPKGTINLHASLLPDYRGAAPINRVIMNGEKETGVTTFFIEKDIDTGNILFSERVPITPEMNAGELHDILMVKGSALLVKTIDAVAEGNYSSKPQKELTKDKILHKAPKIFRDDCRIRWDLPAESIYNLIRGLSPYPASWTEISGGKEKIVLKVLSARYEIEKHAFLAGSLLSDEKTYIKIAAADGFVYLLKIQAAGRKPMHTEEFLRGFKGIMNYKVI